MNSALTLATLRLFSNATLALPLPVLARMMGRNVMREGKWERFEIEREEERESGKEKREHTLVRLHDDPDLGTDAAVDELCC